MNKVKKVCIICINNKVKKVCTKWVDNVILLLTPVKKYVIVEMGRQCYTTVDTCEKYAYYFREFENYFFLNK